ncbi:uncharacterized protein ACR2FA_006709 [Aphomia sociella]
MITFMELTKQVRLIKDLILSDMICEDKASEEALSFSKHLSSTKHWFARISWANKKRYVLALLEDVRSAWALSLLLKSIWNCRPKDAVQSVSEHKVWSIYDQVPMDHNRTAQPVPTLAQVMKCDRVWFLTLEPQSQAIVLAELLAVSGGPVMWEVLKRAQVLYERYRKDQLQNLRECIVLNNSPAERGEQATPEKLEADLAAWNATIKSMRDSLKIDEIEMTFNDGTKRKIWKVNRTKPEAIETVDFLQLLPSSIGKRIISYLPRALLGDYARVNKYWAYLVEDFRSELAARQKINADLDKLENLMTLHDTSLDILVQIGFQATALSSQGIVSTAPSMKMKQMQPSVRASEKSTGAYSFRHFLSDKLKQPIMTQRPIANMNELTERLDRRGAADENMWKWCENLLKHARHKQRNKGREEGILPLGSMYFPCPLMKEILKVPLEPPLFRDPAVS